MERYTDHFSIGLTGGIGTGKTTVTNHFASLGITIVDADEASRAITANGEPAVSLISKEFGEDILTDQFSLNRSKLRELVFNDPAKKIKLEQLLHPLIRQRMQFIADQANSTYVIFSIPLLIETGQADLFDRILVVDAPDELRVEWIKQRSGLSEPEIEKIIQSQASREERLSIADDIISNDGTLGQLHQQIEQLHQKFLLLAQNAT